MGLKRCLACADVFETSSRVPLQSYCNRQECQRERRRLWQKEKRLADKDYRANQLQCQRRWREGNGDYWQKYRADHPEYVERNRAQQQGRNAARNQTVIAKMDATSPALPFRSGTYRLTPAQQEEVAKMDAWIVKITFLSGT
jgi:hypothetical protein